MNNPYYYKGANPTVDLVLVSPEKKVLLILRSKKSGACPGMWAIPGGFVDTQAKKDEEWIPSHETPEQAAFRELVEETGIEANLLDKSRLQFNGTYEGNGRDPRDNSISWSKSNAFFYLMNESEKHIINTVKGIDDNVDLDDAEDTHWFTFEEMANMKLAFDHNKILEDTLLKINNLNKKNVKKPA